MRARSALVRAARTVDAATVLERIFRCPEDVRVVALETAERGGVAEIGAKHPGARKGGKTLEPGVERPPREVIEQVNLGAARVQVLPERETEKPRAAGDERASHWPSPRPMLSTRQPSARSRSR